MKKLILTIITLLSLNIANAQFDPFNLDEIRLRSLVSTLNNYPTSESFVPDVYGYIGNEGINQVNYKNYYKSYRNNSHMVNCIAKRTEDAYIEIDLNPSLQVSWDKSNFPLIQNSTFEVYKEMLNQLGIVDPNFYTVTSFTVEQASFIVGGFSTSNISKFRIYYKKVVEWDCQTYGY